MACVDHASFFRLMLRLQYVGEVQESPSLISQDNLHVLSMQRSRLLALTEENAPIINYPYGEVI